MHSQVVLVEGVEWNLRYYGVLSANSIHADAEASDKLEECRLRGVSSALSEGIS